MRPSFRTLLLLTIVLGLGTGLAIMKYVNRQRAVILTWGPYHSDGVPPCAAGIQTMCISGFDLAVYQNESLLRTFNVQGANSTSVNLMVSPGTYGVVLRAVGLDDVGHPIQSKPLRVTMVVDYESNVHLSKPEATEEEPFPTSPSENFSQI
jgi:hypothetical protein